MFKRTYIDEAIHHVGESITIAGWVSRTRDLKKIRFIIIGKAAKLSLKPWQK